MTHRCLLIALLLFASLLAGLAAPTRALPAPSEPWTLVGASEASDWLVYAAPDNVTGIVPDGDLIWASSNGGLLCWDRRTGGLSQYLAPQTPLPGNEVAGAALYGGKLYLSTPYGIAAFDRRGQWTVYRRADIGLPDGSDCEPAPGFGAMALVGDVLWVDAGDALAQLFPDGHWELVRPGPDTFPPYSIARIIAHEDGVYIGFYDEEYEDEYYPESATVVRFSDGHWQPVEGPMPEYRVAPDGTYWWGHYGTLLKSSDRGATWGRAYAGGYYLTPHAFDEAGRVYISDGDAILVLQDGQVAERYSYAEVGPPLTYISDVECDAAGRVWVATDSWGLTMYDGREWHNWRQANSDLGGDRVGSVTIAGGRAYATVYTPSDEATIAILDVERGAWTHLWPGRDLDASYLGEPAVDSRRRLFVPIPSGALGIYGDGAWKQQQIPFLSSPQTLYNTHALFDARGDYWLAAGDQGLLRYNGTTWAVYMGVTGHLPGDYANGLATDPAGRLWVATNKGLAVRDVDGGWYAYAPEGAREACAAWVSAVAVDGEGRAWALLGSDLAVFNGEAWQAFGPEAVGATYWGSAIAFDAGGHAWVGTGGPNGVAVYRGRPALDPLVSLDRRGAATTATRIGAYGRGALAGLAFCTLGLLMLAVTLSVGIVVWALRRKRRRARRVAI